MEEKTAHLFNPIFVQGDASYYVITEEFSIDDSDLVQRIIVRGCVFQKHVSFTKTKFHDTVEFIDCTFKEGIYIAECSFADDLVFRGCSLADDELRIDGITVWNLEFDEIIGERIVISGKIESNSFDESITFTECIIGSIDFVGAVITNPIDIKTSEAKLLYALESTFESTVTLGGYNKKNRFKTEDITFESCRFAQSVNFSYGEVTDALLVRNTYCKNQLSISHSFKVKRASFSTVNFTSIVDYYIEESAQEINISDCTLQESFFIHGPLSNLSSSFGYIETSLSLTLSGVIKGNVIVSKVPIEALLLFCTSFGNIQFNGIQVSVINMYYLYNYGNIVFNDTKVSIEHNHLVIANSKAGNIEFLNINFREFRQVVILKSDVSSLQFTNSTPPLEIYIEAKENDVVKLNGQERARTNLYFRDSYRQLKLAMQKMDNRYYTLLYKSKEMYYHRKEQPLFSWDWFLLAVNWISNRHGISWIQGIRFTIAVSIIFFLILNRLRETPVFIDPTETMWDNLSIAGQQFINYLSSFPKLTLEGLDEADYRVNLTIFFSRIFIGIGIYQTITAFRKYGGK